MKINTAASISSKWSSALILFKRTYKNFTFNKYQINCGHEAGKVGF